MVLLHGTPSSSHIWRNVVPKLVAAGYKVHLFDLLGYGASERPLDPATDTSVSGQVPVLKHTMEISDRLDELENLPVQILWGEQDAWQVVDWAHKLHEAIPGSTLHILPNCGHFAMEDQPDEISNLMLDFLKNHLCEPLQLKKYT